MWWGRIIIAKAGGIWVGEVKKPLVYGVRGLLAGMGKDARHREPRDEGPMV